MNDKEDKKRGTGGIVLFILVIAGLAIAADHIYTHYRYIHTQTSHLIGTVYDINHESRSFVFGQYSGYSGFEEFFVDGEMPLVTGKCLNIEYTPKIEFGFFLSTDPHQIRIKHASLSSEGQC